MPNLPFRLSEGVLLEDVGLLIPWNSTLKDLKKLASPKTRKESDKFHLHWNKTHHWLSGLECYFNTTFFDSKYSVKLANDAQTNQNLSLDFMNFSTPDSGKTPRTEFERVKEHISRVLGRPTANYENYKFGLPLVEWHIQEILIVFMVFERFGEYCLGEIWHNPPDWRLANNHQQS